MASDKSFLVLVHYRESIKKKTRSKIKFSNKDPLGIFLKPSTSFTEFQNTILQKLGLHGMKRVEKLLYRILICVLSDDVNSGGSNWNPQSSAMPTYCSSMPLVALSSVLVIAPEAVLVASSSFVANLNRNLDGKIGDTGPLDEFAIATSGTPVMVLVFREGGVPDGVEDALHNDDDDVDFTTITDDNDDDIARTTPVVGGGASSSGTH
ncbi:hypothetical protein Ahy_B08g090050 [Arachis hypogaea]|uniref:Uncharacterized protein n=1 Tax=Arachis hypogaea TaxID=3818 RepID=A0A444XZH3_ARAHY|nr:hypothetical protein Ahy_B08g090050 [Arachis hypogaea]